ncbi:MAG: choice-of-anchor I family protein, partial [Halothece sp.]
MATIAEIQGAGHTSPLVGETITAEGGIVTAVQGNGFYIQDPEGDGDSSTSEGLFIFTGDTEPSVNVGDKVNVTGEVSEFQPGPQEARNLTQTQIAFPDNVEVLSSGNEVPTPVTIGQGGRIPPSENIDDDDFSQFNPSQAGIDFFESVEGMLVTAQDAQAVGPTNRFGEIFTVVDNGENATGISDRGTLNISEDDFNPEKVQIDFKQEFLPDNFNFPQVNVGAQLGDVTGVVSYDFGNFQIQPTTPFTATSSNIQPETSTIQAGGENLSLASFNVLNLDPKVENVENVANQDQGEVDDDVGNGRFDAIANQIVNNLNTPDIIGLQEIQDNDGAEISNVSAADETLQLLVDRIEAAGGPSYKFIDTPGIVPAFENEQGEIVRPTGGQPGGNIRNAFLYNPERVNLVEGSVEPLTDPQDQAENPDNPFFGSRIPLSATFEFNGEEVTVINNHFSSKGGSSAILGQDQPFEELQNGAQKDLPQDVLNSLAPEERFVNGSFNERIDQAEAVKQFVDNLNADNIIALGDLNEFEFVKPVETLESSLTNLIDTKIPEGERYSFIFQGNSQQLDHILVSNNLAQQAQLDIVHTNNEFADQASDHEPLLASLNLSSDNNMTAPQPSNELQLSVAGRFTTGVFNEGAAEIVDYDPETQRLFVVNSNATTVDILDVSNPNNPTRVNQIDASQFGDGANSVAVKNGIVAVAIEAGEIDAKGKVVFFDTDGNQLGSAEVGVLPDKVAFSPDGTKVITANEGEPNSDYTIDPKGSVSIIDISGGAENLSIDNVANAGFTQFNDQKQELIDQGVRIFGPSPGDDNETATVAQDLEPEFVTVTPDNNTAYVSLQENNALAKVDLNAGEVADILPLGVKDHSNSRNQLDPSDEDGGINFQTIPSMGLFQPDAIDNFTVDGQTFIITANEGDAREFEGNPGFVEEVGLQDLLNNNRLDLNDDDKADVGSTQVSSEETINDLLAPERLGELDFTNATGDTDGDGLIEQLQNFGGRSFSVWNESGELVFDSADDFEQIIADQIEQGILPEAAFNNDNEENAPDSRSDDKGPEPEAVTTGRIDGTPYAFIGLERVGGIMVYNLSNPSNPQFVQYVNNRNFVDDQGNLIPVQSEDGSPNPAAGDLGPEGITFISAEDSPNGEPLVAVGNEISGSTTVYNVNVADQPEEPEPEAGGPVFGSTEADTLEATIDFEGDNNVLFTGAGNDQIFASQGEGNNRIYAGEGSDELVASTEDRL